MTTAGSGRACPTAASKRPFSAIHEVPRAQQLVHVPYTGTVWSSRFLLESGATQVTTVALCMVSQHNLGKPGRSQAEPWCTPLPALQCSRPVPTSPCCQRQMLGIPWCHSARSGRSPTL